MTPTMAFWIDVVLTISSATAPPHEREVARKRQTQRREMIPHPRAQSADETLGIGVHEHVLAGGMERIGDTQTIGLLAERRTSTGRAMHAPSRPRRAAAARGAGQCDHHIDVRGDGVRPPDLAYVDLQTRVRRRRAQRLSGRVDERVGGVEFDDHCDKCRPVTFLGVPGPGLHQSRTSSGILL